MELIGVLEFCDGVYWVSNETEGWVCLFGVGDTLDVLVGGKWLSHDHAERRVSGAIPACCRWAVAASGVVYASACSLVLVKQAAKRL